MQKIKKQDITLSNYDDYLRQEKRRGATRLFWKGESLKKFRLFAGVTFYAEGYRLPRDFPNGDMFMGIKHFKRS